MPPGKKRQRQCEIRAQLFRRARLPGIFASDRKSASQRHPRALKTADVIALPAMQRDPAPLKAPREPSPDRLQARHKLRRRENKRGSHGNSIAHQRKRRTQRPQLGRLAGNVLVPRWTMCDVGLVRSPPAATLPVTPHPWPLTDTSLSYFTPICPTCGIRNMRSFWKRIGSTRR